MQSSIFCFTKNFNSHAHVERDPIATFIQKKTEISTHTLTWSVTQMDFLIQKMQEFQLTRSRGACQEEDTYNTEEVNFNSHAHVERDNIIKNVLTR